MVEKKQTKIQPADIADEQVGQPSAQEATGDLTDYTAEQIAGMKPDEVAAKLNNANAFIKSATQKSQEAAEIRRQNEETRAQVEYWKSQAEEATKNMQKFYEQMSQTTRQQTQSAPSQPPEFDPYNPDKSFEASQKWHQEQLQSTRDELRKELDELKNKYEETNVGLSTLKMEQYLKKAIPEFGKDVTIEEVDTWAKQHPNADYSKMDTLNQAIREVQAGIDDRNKARWEKYVAEKEKAQEGAQETPGSEFVGEMRNVDKFVEANPSEKDAMVMEYFNRAAKKVQGGGG